MKICENCGIEHDGIYGSGRFCSCKCARGFSTKLKRKEINSRVSKKLTGRKLSSNHKESLRKAQKLAPSRKGFKMSEEQKLKISKSLKGYTHSDETKKKISQAIKGKAGGYRKNSGIGKKGWYKGYWCDSSYELAFVIYNLEHGIKFARNTKRFEYEFENKKYYYIPDFIMNDGTYVEIKNFITDRVLAKHEQFPHKLIVICGKKEISSYLDYVITKYGRNFIELYE